MENEAKKEQQVAPLRQIVIETNGRDVFLKKAEVAGPIELTALLQIIIEFVNRKDEVKKAESPVENK